MQTLGPSTTFPLASLYLSLTDHPPVVLAWTSSGSVYIPGLCPLICLSLKSLLLACLFSASSPSGLFFCPLPFVGLSIPLASVFPSHWSGHHHPSPTTWHPVPLLSISLSYLLSSFPLYRLVRLSSVCFLCSSETYLGLRLLPAQARNPSLGVPPSSPGPLSRSAPVHDQGLGEM